MPLSLPLIMGVFSPVKTCVVQTSSKAALMVLYSLTFGASMKTNKTSRHCKKEDLNNQSKKETNKIKTKDQEKTDKETDSPPDIYTEEQGNVRYFLLSFHLSE